MKSLSVWMFRYFGLKVLSIGLAVLLWMVVAGEEVVERGLRVPLELQQFPSGLELQAEPPGFVDVRVRGGSGTLARLTPSDIVAVLDLRTARRGRRLFQMTPEEVRVPFGIEVVQISPAGIALVFERSVTRQVPVVPAVEGDPAPGYVVGKLSVEPPTVAVIGPETAVNDVEEALTEPVAVTGARNTVVEQVSVGFENPVLRLKTPRLARVAVEVLPGPSERALRNVPVHLRNLSAGVDAQVSPSNVDLVLRGSRQALARLGAAEVTAFVDLAGLGVGDYTIDVRVEAGTEVGASRVDPSTVQVRIVRTKN
jgi:YbbR domain-containing protein